MAEPTVEQVLRARDHDLAEYCGDTLDDRLERESIIRMTNSMLPPEHQMNPDGTVRES